MTSHSLLPLNITRKSFHIVRRLARQHPRLLSNTLILTPHRSLLTAHPLSTHKSRSQTWLLLVLYKSKLTNPVSYTRQIETRFQAHVFLYRQKGQRLLVLVWSMGGQWGLVDLCAGGGLQVSEFEWVMMGEEEGLAWERPR